MHSGLGLRMYTITVSGYPTHFRDRNSHHCNPASYQSLHPAPTQHFSLLYLDSDTQYQATMYDTVTSRIRRRNGSKHDRTGCLTCRYRYARRTPPPLILTHHRYSSSHRHKKCTENTFPECGACIRLNLKCVREPKRQVAPDPRAQTGESSTAPSVRTVDFFHNRHPFAIQETNRSSMRQYAMKYYIDVIAQVLAVTQQYNSFLSGASCSLARLYQPHRH